jgi:hypothetical protein
MTTTHFPLDRIDVHLRIPADHAKSVSLRSLTEPVDEISGAYVVPDPASPGTAIKELANGDRVVISRTPQKDRTHAIVVSYEGSLENLGAARFALDNVLHDLATVGIFPKLDPTITLVQPTETPNS